MFSSFPFGIEGEVWDVIVLIPDHCLLFTFPGQLCFGIISAVESTQIKIKNVKALPTD